MIRHQFAISQRSTRYVDEYLSEYKTHPLIERYLRDGREPLQDRDRLRRHIEDSIEADRANYLTGVGLLEDYLRRGGIEGTVARKQARGAARGYLGNGLGTEMVFSAPVSGWRWIFSQRLSGSADAEIRAIMADAYRAIQGSRYGDRFPEQLVPSPDGIGMILE